ncbi:MAG: hypothetical protein CMA59_00895 [Euryarchaeota archaeon]|jgi:hypothetical protein|nr:hypothetical protein [Euryarchaeota archaeon]
MKEIEEKFMTQSKFASLVEDRVKESNGLINYIEAVASVCEEFEIEVETVSKLISKPLKDKIKWDAQQLNYMKRTSRAILNL